MDVPACKLFTIEEANLVIPFLERSLDVLQVRVKEIVRLKRQLEVLNLICGSELSHDNPDFRDHSEKTGTYHQLIGEADAMIREIRLKGCLLRDVHSGIVDFYCRYNGRVVYLCWRKGERQISYWHPIGEGFGKRRRLATQNRQARDSNT
ncbi:MAG: DUF2203 domain-containing protein [Candidatus Eiseniibacteriota bacterium]|jgi:hypothetical protein